MKAVLTAGALWISLLMPAWADWTVAGMEKRGMGKADTLTFMKRLATYVVEHHMRRDEVPMKGMCYEYLNVARLGREDQFIEGEALDTMHDGAWFGVAMAQAARASGDPFFKDTLVKWVLPFYLKMLNESDVLFSADRNDAEPERRSFWGESKEWLLQAGEKGFVPYWWDDGTSVSLDMRNRKSTALAYPGNDEFRGLGNGAGRLKGHSLGSSNHLAQDLAVLLISSHRLLNQSPEPSDKKLLGEISKAARNLQACRTRHGSPDIPVCLAALAICSGDQDARSKLQPLPWKDVWKAQNQYRSALLGFQKDKKYSLPAFADDQMFRYFTSCVTTGDEPCPVSSFRVIYDAFTLPQLYHSYCDDEPAPPGINVFDLHPFAMLNGCLLDLRSDKKGPGGKPRPVGSRCGPQNMACAGWALQLLRKHPGLWDQAGEEMYPGKVRVLGYCPLSCQELKDHVEFSEGENNTFFACSTASVQMFLKRELGCGLRVWEAIFNSYGYIPTAIGGGEAAPGVAWDSLSDTGGYAHLIHAGSQWLFYLDGKSDWE